MTTKNLAQIKLALALTQYVEQKLDMLSECSHNENQIDTSILTCPDEEQLASFSDKLLPNSEMRHIKSHLVDCSDCFSRWVALTESMEQIQKTKKIATSEKLKTLWHQVVWSKFYPAFGAVFATCFAMILAYPLVFSPSTLEEDVNASFRAYNQLLNGQFNQQQWLATNQTKSFFSIVSYPDKEAFAAGVRKGLTRLVSDSDYWQKIIVQLPEQPLSCMDNQERTLCEQANQLTYTLGQWSTVMFMSCQNQEHNQQIAKADFYWKEQQNILYHINTLYQKNHYYSNLAKRLDNFVQSVAHHSDTKSYLCQGVFDLVHYGMQR